MNSRGDGSDEVKVQFVVESDSGKAEVVQEVAKLERHLCGQRMSG